MSIFSPQGNWFRYPEGGERMWIGLALVWCIIMFIAMPFWHFFGKQNATGESYTVEARDFEERVDRFVEANQVDEIEGVPVVEVPSGGDIYLLGRMWQWEPVLKLQKGETYRLHVSSTDLQHGLSILPLNINFQVLPGYDHVITMTTTTSGTFDIICNEFCGVGHHWMTGRIIVEE